VSDPANLHVIFGSGQVGSLLARDLAAAGARVRVVRRSAGPAPEGGELARGDATDPGFCRAIARGASAVYHCMNPAYSTRLWAEQVPRFAENLVAAAGAGGARLVVLDNLYMLRPTGGRPIDEDTPFGPVSRKGEIRARAARRYLEAQARGEARVVVGRASDFYGPGGEGSHFGPTFWKGVFEGKPGNLVIPADAIHTYHFIPDVARALLLLGTAPPDVDGKTFMLPCAPAETARALVRQFSAALGREIRIRTMPRPLLALLAPFVPILGEVREMLYQWDAPFVVKDARFRARFPSALPTPPEEGARATVAWARERFAARAA
jgi:nucleoside-diphosphate-sugar epimerase